MKLPWDSYSIKVRDAQGVTVLDLKGKMVGEKDRKTLGERVSQLLAANKKRFVLNLKKVRRIDNYGVAALLGAYKLISEKRGELNLVNPSQEVKKQLDKVFLTAFLDVHDNEQEALTCLK